ncbi:hypothetical protein QR66_18685 [Chromobacterium piscinae]|nr:hypothetical protein QR66_18685 [Chromobacterium piscinae]
MAINRQPRDFRVLASFADALARRQQTRKFLFQHERILTAGQTYRSHHLPIPIQRQIIGEIIIAIPIIPILTYWHPCQLLPENSMSECPQLLLLQWRGNDIQHQTIQLQREKRFHFSLLIKPCSGS